MKIHIIGCSGTGKTYFARALAQAYAIPHIDLDDLQWDRTAATYGVRTPPEKRGKMLAEVLSRPDWITEGVYYPWVGQCFADADVIYWLQLPRAVYRTRIIRRFVRRKLGLEPGKKETWRSLRDLLRWTDTFQKVNAPEIASALAPYADKVKILTSVSVVNAEIRRITEEGL